MFKIDTELSEMCSDSSIDSGNFDPFDQNETTYINENGKVETVSDPYGI